MNGRYRYKPLAALCMGMTGVALSGLAAAAEATLVHLSIEQLMDIEVTSVARKPQKLSESASAIYAITREDIRRSGMRSIPELLRMVPGLSVAQFDANKWAITSRGFASLFSDKLQVLIDGRSIYTPLFSGVFWDVQDVPLDDIERIEVIRGPGGTLWGANAVNGVINIITRRAEDTQGGMVSAGAGNLARDEVTARYGGQAGESAHYRIYAKNFDRNHFADATGAATHDAWRQTRGGIRIDWQRSAADSLTLQGDAYSGISQETLLQPSLAAPFSTTIADNAEVRGQNLLARWQRVLADDSDFALQLYYDHTFRKPAALVESRDTYDIDLQHRFRWGGRHELVWGAGYRMTRDTASNNTFLISLAPPGDTLTLPSAFVQDESSWLDDRLRVAVGSKFERNTYTGMEYQPNLRVLWKASEEHTLWAAVSRAVRTPSRGETGIRVASQAFPSTIPGVTTLAVLFGNPNLDSEKLTAYEIGYRGHLRNDLLLDATAFYNDYSRLVTHEPGATFIEPAPLPPHLVVALNNGNMAYGHVHGGELSVNWQATEKWRLGASYSLLRFSLHLEPGSGDVAVRDIPGNSPRQQWQLHSWLDLSHDLELDGGLYYVDGLPTQGVAAYTRLDVRLGWKPAKDLELALTGQNLTSRRHQEFGSSPSQTGSQVPRSIYGGAIWRF